MNILAGAASRAIWGPEAAAVVSEWRFKPGMKDGKAISVPCSVDLVWGPQNLTAGMLDGIFNASAIQELDEAMDKARSAVRLRKPN